MGFFWRNCLIFVWICWENLLPPDNPTYAGSTVVEVVVVVVLVLRASILCPEKIKQKVSEAWNGS